MHVIRLVRVLQETWKFGACGDTCMHAECPFWWSHTYPNFSSDRKPQRFCCSIPLPLKSPLARFYNHATCQVQPTPTPSWHFEQQVPMDQHGATGRAVARQGEFQKKSTWKYNRRLMMMMMMMMMMLLLVVVVVVVVVVAASQLTWKPALVHQWTCQPKLYNFLLDFDNFQVWCQ